MNRSPRQREGNAKGEESVAKPPRKAKAATTMDRFKRLTCKLLSVSNEQVKEEQRRFDLENAARRKERGGRDG